jgi:hypothetical protein
MREGVAELVSVQPRQASLRPAAAQHHPQPRVGELALLTQATRGWLERYSSRRTVSRWAASSAAISASSQACSTTRSTRYACTSAKPSSITWAAMRSSV